MTRFRIVLLALAVLGGAACTPADAIKLTFGMHGDAVEGQARRVAACESGNGGDFSTVDPGAVSPTNDHGLMQINYQWRDEFVAVTGQPWSSVYNPFWNAVFAKWLWEQDGWSHWTCRHAA